MRNGTIVALTVVGAALVLTPAIVEGILTNRWGTNDNVQAAARKLERVPHDFGDWVGTDVPLDSKVVRVAEAVGNVSRVYVNKKNSERVNVLILCGPTGPIGAHTPEACYGGLGYSCRGTPLRKGFALPNGDAAGFWTARFEKATPTDAPMRVFWAWSTNGIREASSNPRTEYALRSSLYKLYLVQSDNPAERPRDPNQEPQAVEQFLMEFLPLVKTALGD